ncbi:LLM class flavin-dependent oxidoreductase [Paenibacillus filicis]|uniref:LLM class flavin-dependent oxidoreductase n=1 Tax=Paenibacillus filicis TaxID=669464 RepID=A0ABU9DG90_9BACL
MANPHKQFHLAVFLLAGGHHVSGWRHPEADALGVHDFQYYKRLAQTAERGKFDAFFFADVLGIGQNDKRFDPSNVRLDPMLPLAALAVVTERIGLVATVSTSYNEPFNVARRFATLDHLSNGRASWNVVTSFKSQEANNFNQHSLPDPSLRYEKAREFVQVVKGLWDTWEEDALVADKESGIFSLEEKIHDLNHEGKYFSVRGPLNISRPPQGHPVIFQAGTSEGGKELAAETAEAVFTAWSTLEKAQEYYRDVKGRMARYGRAPDQLKIMLGLIPIVGRTEEEAERKEQELQSLLLPEVGVAKLSYMFGYDLSPFPIDEPLPQTFNLGDAHGASRRFQPIKDIADREQLTIRQLYERYAGNRGHLQVRGTPEQIADVMEEWFVAGAADGFNILPPYLPGGLDDFVDLVVPELQKRGLFRTEYEGTTLREHFGLSRPANRFH